MLEEREHQREPDLLASVQLESRTLADFLSSAPELVDQLKRTHEPLELTIDGKTELVVQDAVSYQNLLNRLSELEVSAVIQVGLDDVAAGRVIPLEEAMNRMRAKLGFPR